MARLTGRGSRIKCRRCGFDVADASRKSRVEIILREIQVRVRGKWLKMTDNM